MFTISDSCYGIVILLSVSPRDSPRDSPGAVPGDRARMIFMELSLGLSRDCPMGCPGAVPGLSRDCPGTVPGTVLSVSPIHKVALCIIPFKAAALLPLNHLNQNHTDAQQE